MTVTENNVAGLSVPLMASGTHLLFALRMSECAGDRAQSVKSLPCEHKDLILRNMFKKKKVRCSGALVISAPRRLGQSVSGVCWTDPNLDIQQESLCQKNNVESDPGRCTRG